MIKVIEIFLHFVYRIEYYVSIFFQNCTFLTVVKPVPEEFHSGLFLLPIDADKTSP